jgi:hypothetical protein
MIRIDRAEFRLNMFALRHLIPGMGMKVTSWRGRYGPGDIAFQ